MRASCRYIFLASHESPPSPFNASPNSPSCTRTRKEMRHGENVMERIKPQHSRIQNHLSLSQDLPQKTGGYKVAQPAIQPSRPIVRGAKPEISSYSLIGSRMSNQPQEQNPEPCPIDQRLRLQASRPVPITRTYFAVQRVDRLKNVTVMQQ